MCDLSAQFNADALEFVENHPDFKFESDYSESPFLTGKITLKDANGDFIDEYDVQIKSSKNYPNQFPLVYEVGGRLPHNIEWHVFPDGHCCIKAIPEELILCKKGIKLDWFLKEQLFPYFFNQKHRELHGYYLKERSHGTLGMIEYFEEVFKTKDLNLLIKGLEFVKNRKEPGRTAICFCGSGLKYRKCHREAYRTFLAMSNSELEACISLISDFRIGSVN